MYLTLGRGPNTMFRMVMNIAAFRAMLLIISADMTIILRLARTIGAKPSAISCGISMYGFNIIFLKCPRPSAGPVTSVVCSATASGAGLAGLDSAAAMASTSANPRTVASEPAANRGAFIVRVAATKKTLISGGSGDLRRRRRRRPRPRYYII